MSTTARTAEQTAVADRTDEPEAEHGAAADQGDGELTQNCPDNGTTYARPLIRDQRARHKATGESVALHVNRLRQRLIDRGIDPDEPPPPPVYLCPLCHDAGFVYARDANGNTDYSRVVPCPGPGCTQARVDRSHSLSAVARTRGVYAPEQTFKTFERRRGSDKACQYARELAEGRAPFIWLLIFGGPGNGKSHLCNAMAQTALQRHVDVRLVPLAEMFTTLRSAMDGGNVETVMQQYKHTWFLILDDYGVQYGSDWEGARFDELMTYRYANYLPTAMTTNMDVANLPDRIRSRFQDIELSRVVHNSALDYRPAQRTQVAAEPRQKAAARPCLPLTAQR